jgi:hypothetical protein
VPIAKAKKLSEPVTVNLLESIVVVVVCSINACRPRSHRLLGDDYR